MCEIALKSSEKCVFRRIVLLHGATRLYHSFFIPDTVAFDLSVVYAEHGAAANHVKPSVNGEKLERCGYFRKLGNLIKED